ncbi:hypothetical protein MGAST_11905 [Mycobacterium gastri 'Wayne']|uniref:NAD-dependent epimerase/dehydratase domain-containing protein n=1 Tax=Mycobacterium gastri TaxID=1777 RepID=A0A1X1VSS4_MYCGS|nr:hypothetical protein MGAST_11905 [Mycobacterium gastri 'Wayne']ORV72091.1 hypothetical protein AWC07_04120 [Mycobacterium gastri]
MRFLVTGATGYVGSRLVTALLADGHQVLAAGRSLARLRRLVWLDDVTPLAGALRTSLDILITLTPKVLTV